jgi:hypothetical protein
MSVTETDEIPLGGKRKAVAGPAFISKRMRGTTWGGDVKALSKLVNPEDISRLVVFDTWTLNCDRYPANPKARRPNRDNIFLSQEDVEPSKFRLVAIDHGHCFTCGEELTRRVANISHVKDGRVYGAFPEFRRWIRAKLVEEAAKKLGQIEPEFVAKVVDSIPAEWDVTRAVRSALKRLIFQRAAFLVSKVAKILEPYCKQNQKTFDWVKEAHDEGS